MRISRAAAFISIVFVIAIGARVSSQEQPLTAARQLYASADYEQALVALDRLKAGGYGEEEGESIELYRALCLLAMGRKADADAAIQAIIDDDPLYNPPEDISPRVRTAFSDVKKRLLPGVVQQRYAEAKTAFDDKNFKDAAEAFEEVIAALNDPDISAAAAKPPLSDMRTLAAGFHELAVKATPPPPPPPAPVVAAAAAPVAAPPQIYTGAEPNVIPPTAIRQDLPKFVGTVGRNGLSGVVEIVINELGDVESSFMAVPTKTSYDATVAVAATRWHYEPATVNGKPVKFKKRIQVKIAAGQ
jgi:hypothetical protein